MTTIRNLRFIVVAAGAALGIAASHPALAAGGHDGALGHGGKKTGAGHGHSAQGREGQPEIGHAGEAAEIDRTIAVEMFDNYFEPGSVSLEEGETVRFEIVNRGQFVHEFNIATAAMHQSHQAEMMKMMSNGVLGVDRIDHGKMGAGGMSHDHANSALLEPGDSAEVIWTFDTHADLEFACNVPGHYESGMTGPIKLRH